MYLYDPKKIVCISEGFTLQSDYLFCDKMLKNEEIQQQNNLPVIFHDVNINESMSAQQVSTRSGQPVVGCAM